MQVSGRKEVVDHLKLNGIAWCEPCEGEKDGRQPAAGFCETCEEYMCDNCLSCHRKSRLGKTHSISCLQNLPSSNTSNKDLKDKKTNKELNERCPIHTDEALKYFCKDHNQLCCVDCRLLSHTSCKQFETISKLCENQTTQISFDSINKRLKNLVGNIDSEMEKATRNSKVNEIQYQKLQEDVDHFVEDITNTLARLKRELKEIVCGKEEKNTQMIEQTTKECQNLKREIGELQTECEMLLKGKKQTKYFVLMKKAENDLCKWEEAEKKIKEMNIIELNVFSPGNEIKKLLKQDRCLGMLTEAGECCTCKTVNVFFLLMCGHKQCVKCTEKPCGLCPFPDTGIVKGTFHDTRGKGKYLQAKRKDSKTPLLVAAIDFGTTYSGWAFSFLHEYKANPTNITVQIWTDGHQILSSKVPTCILIKPDGKTFDSFGYLAESKYADLVTDDEHEPWYFFRRFTMLLYGKIGIERNINLEEERKQKSLPAKTVFSLSIRFLKDDLLQTAEKRALQGSIKPEEIHWVLTVPAIWNDAAKEFMREAAEEAGISRDNLTIALEPEAAFWFCRYLNVNVDKNLGDKELSLASLKAGQTYVILDAGGDTVDITVHEVQKEGGLKELQKASGGPWGGTKVDDEFLKLLEKIFGMDVMKRMKTNCVDEYLTMLREFELKKRIYISKSSEKVIMLFPFKMFEIVQEITGKTVSDNIQASSYAGKISVRGEKLFIDDTLFRGLFHEAIGSIIKHLNMLFQIPQVRRRSTILMVGGFSESPLLQEAVRQNFKSARST